MFRAASSALGLFRRRRPGPGGGPHVSPSLYERLGGKDAIVAVVDDFVARCAGDTRINGKFARTDIPRLKTSLVDIVEVETAATGTALPDGYRNAPPLTPAGSAG